MDCHHSNFTDLTHSLLCWALFPLELFFLEALLCLASGNTAGLPGSLPFFVLFGAAYGTILTLIVTAFSNPACRSRAALALLLILPVPFGAEYFVYRQFKIFYDLNTVTGGAANALTEFTEDILRMVFSPSGITVLVLLFLPAILFVLWGRTRFFPGEITGRHRRNAALAALAAYGLALVLIASQPSRAACYGEEYSFPSAVNSFGLVTGLRLDVKNNLTHSEDSFEAMAVEEESEPEELTPDPQPQVYGFHTLDLDFQALAEQSTGQVSELHSYVDRQKPARRNQYTGLFRGKNLIMITAEAFSAEVIDPELTPTLYRMATRGINFTDYYQPSSAGTTGGEYQNIFGFLPTSGGRSLKNTADHLNYFTMGSQLDRLGYYGKAFHNNLYTYYDRHKTHNNLGYSDGYMGYGNGMEQYVEDRWPQSDLEMIRGTLPTYIDKSPFNIYYMTVSGHSSYNRIGNYQSKKHWDRVAHLDCSDEVKAYLAANLELEDAMTYLISQLEAKGIADDTVICIATDHFPYGLESSSLTELYGYPVTDSFTRDHSRLILWCGSLEDEEPIVVDAPTSSLDIVPTLSNLMGTEYDSRLFPGRDALSDADPLVFNLAYDWKTDLGIFLASTGKFTAAEGVTVPEGYVKRMQNTVKNKVRYCKGVLDTDYFRLLMEADSDGV